jgi:hypothetical protein
MIDGWSRKQYAALETRLDEAADILEELWQEESKVFANWPIPLQRGESGGAETARLHVMESLILDLHALLENLDGLDRPLFLQRSHTDTAYPAGSRRSLPLLD